MVVKYLCYQNGGYYGETVIETKTVENITKIKFVDDSSVSLYCGDEIAKTITRKSLVEVKQQDTLKIRRFLFVEKDTVKSEDLEDLSEDTKIIVYKQGSPRPELRELSENAEYKTVKWETKQ